MHMNMENILKHSWLWEVVHADEKSCTLRNASPVEFTERCECISLKARAQWLQGGGAHHLIFSTLVGFEGVDQVR